jgi:putative ABC transport system substrate-binding protein
MLGFTAPGGGVGPEKELKRRRFLVSAGLASAGAVLGSCPVWAQAVPRVGFLISGDPEPTTGQFRAAMAEVGYVEGRTIRVEYRSADPASGKLTEYAAELARMKIDAIVAVLSPAVVAAQKATTTIPIVFSGGAPEIGAVGNVARPEGNLTGVNSASTTVAGKAIQLFYQARPAIRRFGLVLNSNDPFHVPLQRDVEAMARADEIELVQQFLKSRDEIGPAIAELAGRGVAGALIQPSLGLDTAAAAALKHRMPAISFRREFAEKGGLLSYGADQADIYRLVARKLQRVLKGAAPKDLPIEQASRYELVVNLRTAKALGFTFPQVFMARVDEVIE